MKLFVFWIVVIVLVVRSPYFHYMFTMYWLSAKGHPLNDFLPHSIVATLKFSKNKRTTETVACCFWKQWPISSRIKKFFWQKASMLPTQSLYAYYMLTISSLYTHCMLTVCSLYAHYTLTVRSLYAHYMLTICSLYARHMTILLPGISFRCCFSMYPVNWVLCVATWAMCVCV